MRQHISYIQTESVAIAALRQSGKKERSEVLTNAVNYVFEAAGKKYKSAKPMLTPRFSASDLLAYYV